MAGASLLKPLPMSGGCQIPVSFISIAKNTHPPHFSRESIRTPRVCCFSPPFPLRIRRPNVPLAVKESNLELHEGESEVGLSDWDGGRLVAEEGEGDDAFAGEDEERGITAESGEGISEEPEGSHSQLPPEDTRLFVGNIPYEIDSKNLAYLFQNAGTVELAEVIRNRETGESRGFGYVYMSTVEEAEKAIEQFHSYDLIGRLLHVNKVSLQGSRPSRKSALKPSFCAYVWNIPWQVDDEKLKQAFSNHGKVLGAIVVYDRVTRRSRGFGFVTMSTKAELDNAIAALNGQNMNGRLLHVAKEAPQGSRPSRTRELEPSACAYVRNIPQQVDVEKLKQAFGKYGKVLDARVMYHRVTRASRGFGFVTMSTKAELDKSIDALDGQDFEGSTLLVSVSISNQSYTSRGADRLVKDAQLI